MSDLQKAMAIFLHDAQVVIRSRDYDTLEQTYGGTMFWSNGDLHNLADEFVRRSDAVADFIVSREAREALYDLLVEGLPRQRVYSTDNEFKCGLKVTGVYASILGPNQLYYEVDGTQPDGTEPFTVRRTYCGAFEILWASWDPAVRTDKEAAE